MTLEFPVAEWHGLVEDQVEKFGLLMRHSVPLVWRERFHNCEGLKVNLNCMEQFPNVDFRTMCEELLKPENIQPPSLKLINVKSANIG